MKKIWDVLATATITLIVVLVVLNMLKPYVGVMLIAAAVFVIVRHLLNYMRRW